MTLVATLPVGGRPKRDIIEIAFDDCGLAGYEFDRTPEEQSMALRKLNAMMMEWPWSLLGYAQPSYGVGQADGGSGLPDEAINAVAQYLALRIAPGIGNSVSGELRATMARSMARIEAMVATIPRIQPAPGTPTGSGYGRQRFIADESTADPIVVDGDYIVVSSE